MISNGKTVDAKGTYVDESGGQDDASTELFQDDKDYALLRHARERRGEYWTEDTDRASHEYDEE